MSSRFTAVVAFCAVLLPNVAAAQEKSRADNYSLLLTTAIMLMPLDESITSAIAAPAHRQNRVFQSTEKMMYRYGQPGVLLIALGTLGAGLATGTRELTDMGLHTTEAIAASGTVTWLLKGAAGRLRPNASPENSQNFTFGGGWTGKGGASFPSGHATAAFAFAATTSAEIRIHYPEASKYVTPLVYSAAALVGVSRVYKQKHWASDVMLGAAIGYISGKQVFKLNHRSKKE